GVKASPDGSVVYAGGGGVIDTATNSVIAPLPGVGVDIAVSPSGTRLYAPNFLYPSVYVIDPATQTIIATIPVLERPLGFAVPPSGNRVYVAQNTNAFPALSVIDPATNTVINTVQVGPAPSTVGQFIAPPCGTDNDCDDSDPCTVDACSLGAFCQ